jgi:hypothetical protein
MIGQYCIEQDFLAIDKLCLCSAIPKWRIGGQILLDGGLGLLRLCHYRSYVRGSGWAWRFDAV